MKAKLVRDKIPSIILAHGDLPTTHRAKGWEIVDLLIDKLHEEAEELRREPSMEELTDIAEVLDALCVELKVPKQLLRKSQKKKARERGSFKGRIVLDHVE